MASVVLDRLVSQLEKLPGIGPRSAERIAFYLLRESTEQACELAEAIRDLKLKLRHCSVCFNLTDEDPCTICQSPKRDHSVICVVEQPKDLAIVEATGVYNGVYHILLGRLSPMEGIGPEQLTIDRLVERIKVGDIKEVIMATNPTLEGDGTAMYVGEIVSGLGVKVTRLARGLAIGSQLEYTSKATLADAISERKKL
ncbi:MAG: recombination protein RecR [Phycisphaerae bacterium]|jgi:recombination protein RecR|nr:recombination protein RecR [Phycisphaerae bacterium]